jgi:hypothetical protein
MTTWNTKADPGARLALLGAAPTDRLNLLVYSAGGIMPLQIDALQAAGSVVRTSTGRVATVSVPAAQATGLADLDFVDQIQLAESLYDE